MASVYVGVYRATSEGFQPTDFTVGSSSDAATEVEVRILDTVTDTDAVLKALKSIERRIQDTLVTGMKR